MPIYTMKDKKGTVKKTKVTMKFTGKTRIKTGVRDDYDDYQLEKEDGENARYSRAECFNDGTVVYTDNETGHTIFR